MDVLVRVDVRDLPYLSVLTHARAALGEQASVDDVLAHLVKAASRGADVVCSAEAHIIPVDDARALKALADRVADFQRAELVQTVNVLARRILELERRLGVLEAAPHARGARAKMPPRPASTRHGVHSKVSPRGEAHRPGR